MTIVVDIGCLDHGGEVSIRPLIARFKPQLFLGFDPHPQLVEGVTEVEGSLCVFSRQAAWLHSGTTGFTVAGTGSAIGEETRPGSTLGVVVVTDGPTLVRCFDFASWMAALPKVDLVVKLDCEGSEYALLERLLARQLDERIRLLLLEWHGDDTARQDAILAGLHCEVEPWG